MALLQFPIPHHCAPVSFNTSAWGSPAAVFASHSRRGVSNVGVGLPTSLWAALLRLSSPCCRVLLNVGIGRRSSPSCRRWADHVAVGSPAAAFFPSPSCGVERRGWAAHVVVGCPAAVFGPPRRCVVWDLGVVVGLAESGGWRC